MRVYMTYNYPSVGLILPEEVNRPICNEINK